MVRPAFSSRFSTTPGSLTASGAAVPGGGGASERPRPAGRRALPRRRCRSARHRCRLRPGWLPLPAGPHSRPGRRPALIFVAMAPPTARADVRLAELLGVLSLAADLGMGQPMEHVLRQCLISLRLARRLGLDEADREVVYYASLLAWVGCHVDAYEQAKWFGDDTALKADVRRVDFATAATGPLFMLRHLGAGRPAVERARLGVAFVADGRRVAEAMLENHWLAADALAARLGLAQRIRDSIEQTFERWDGKGVPEGCERGGDPGYLPAGHPGRRGGGLSPRRRDGCRGRGGQAAARDAVRPAGRGRLHRPGGVAVRGPGRGQQLGRRHRGGASPGRTADRCRIRRRAGGHCRLRRREVAVYHRAFAGRGRPRRGSRAPVRPGRPGRDAGPAGRAGS